MKLWTTQEQMSLCIQIFNNQTMHIEELFLQFYTIHDLTEEKLANNLLTVTELGLDRMKIRGQGYDEASSISRNFNRVKTHNLNKYSLANYVHCTAHAQHSTCTAHACSKFSNFRFL